MATELVTKLLQKYGGGLVETRHSDGKVTRLIAPKVKLVERAKVEDRLNRKPASNV